MNYVASGYVRSGYVRQDNDTVGSFTFDRYAKCVYIISGTPNVDLADMWSKYLEWLSQDENTRNKIGMKYSGFDAIPSGFTGATFFMVNGWKCVYNPNTTTISGVLYSENYGTAYWGYDGNPIYPISVSSVVNTVSTGSTDLTQTINTLNQIESKMATKQDVYNAAIM